MTILVSPILPTVESAIDWLTSRGTTRVVLWAGPDGIRGNGVVTK